MSQESALLSISEYSVEELKRRIDWILDMQDKEHRNCHTHSQRNAYQAVIRHELEVLRSDIERAVTGKMMGEIPF
jgi:hypothetical protein